MGSTDSVDATYVPHGRRPSEWGSIWSATAALPRSSDGNAWHAGWTDDASAEWPWLRSGTDADDAAAAHDADASDAGRPDELGTEQLEPTGRWSPDATQR